MEEPQSSQCGKAHSAEKLFHFITFKRLVSAKRFDGHPGGSKKNCGTYIFTLGLQRGYPNIDCSYSSSLLDADDRSIVTTDE